MLLMKKTIITFALVSSFAFGVSSKIHAQAFCALRDPVTAIKHLHPDLSTYRSIVRTIADRTRNTVAQRLPFSLHRRELGEHTLYVLINEGLPENVVHVRSEKGRWGLVELVWSFDLNLKVTGFQFQRCRDRSRKYFETEAIRSQFLGKGFTELRAMLSRDGTSLSPGDFTVPKDAEALAVTVLRSALKTIAVTEIVWISDLENLRLQAHP